MANSGELDFEVATGQPELPVLLGHPKISHRYRTSDRVSIRAGRSSTRQASVSPDRLVMQQDGLNILQAEEGLLLFHALSLLTLERCAPDEVGVLLERDGELQAGFEGGVARS